MTNKMQPLISVIIPTYNEAATIKETLEHLRPWINRTEIIIVDASTDGTAGLVSREITLIRAPRSRASQMNAGAQIAAGEILLFLHSDTRLPNDFMQQLELALSDHQVVGGAFKMKIDYPGLFFYLTTLGSNLRATLTGVYFGDQTIFVRRDCFRQIGGFPPIDLLEDWEFSLSMKKIGKTVLLPGPVKTSARRWLLHGKWRTTCLMHKIKLLYLLGTSPTELKRMYSDRR